MVKHKLVNKNDKLNVLSNLEISMKRDWDIIRAYSQICERWALLKFS